MHEALYERIDRLKVPVADLADGCRQRGLQVRVADATLRPAVALSRLAGTAVTLRLYLAEGPVDYNEAMARVYELGRTRFRAVLVARNEVPRFTSMGSGGSRVARAHGYVGCVVGGPIRDTQELPEIDFPVFGTAICPDSVPVDRMPGGKSIHFELGTPVDIAGITIRPGDAVVGDNDGLIAVDPGDLEAVLDEAEKIVRVEALIFRLLAEGKTFREVLDLLARGAGGA